MIHSQARGGYARKQTTDDPQKDEQQQRRTTELRRVKDTQRRRAAMRKVKKDTAAHEEAARQKALDDRRRQRENQSAMMRPGPPKSTTHGRNASSTRQRARPEPAALLPNRFCQSPVGAAEQEPAVAKQEQLMESLDLHNSLSLEQATGRWGGRTAAAGSVLDSLDLANGTRVLIARTTQAPAGASKRVRWDDEPAPRDSLAAWQWDEKPAPRDSLAAWHWDNEPAPRDSLAAWQPAARDVRMEDTRPLQAYVSQVQRARAAAAVDVSSATNTASNHKPSQLRVPGTQLRVKPAVSRQPPERSLPLNKPKPASSTKPVASWHMSNNLPRRQNETTVGSPGDTSIFLHAEELADQSCMSVTQILSNLVVSKKSTAPATDASTTSSSQMSALARECERAENEYTRQPGTKQPVPGCTMDRLCSEEEALMASLARQYTRQPGTKQPVAGRTMDRLCSEEEALMASLARLDNRLVSYTRAPSEGQHATIKIEPVHKQISSSDCRPTHSVATPRSSLDSPQHSSIAQGAEWSVSSPRAAGRNSAVAWKVSSPDEAVRSETPDRPLKAAVGTESGLGNARRQHVATMGAWPQTTSSVPRRKVGQQQQPPSQRVRRGGGRTNLMQPA